MNRRNVMLGLAAAPLAATSVSFAQGNSGGAGPIGANLIAQLFPAGPNGTAPAPGTPPIGSFAIQRFVASGGQVAAVGTATITNGLGTLVTTVSQTVTPTVSALALDPPSSGCPIRHLDIAPITITLLGLQITTSEIVLDIVAIPGPGNLLGNLLCTITGLLNPGGGLAGALNQLVTALNGLLAAL
jgi:hypothetical protein